MGEREEAAEAPFPPAVDGEETLEYFQCSICLDLLYKPVILACGHISCFWCVHKSMDHLRESHCAICRQPYKHFPSICPLLHHLLLKREPAMYKRREKEVLEQEKSAGYFSPQFIECLITDEFNEKPNLASGTKCSEGMVEKLLVSDVLCLGCKEILFHPVVLNCGHSFCEACIVDQVNENIKCQICESVHPGYLPKVCLELDYFLKVHFPQEYAQRLALFQFKGVQHQSKGQSSCTSPNENKGNKASHTVGSCNGMILLDEDLPNIHLGVGCDTCGMYPIIGKRYKCKDCKETIGFDLCEACYNTSSKRPGRFNQQHTPDHAFILDDSQLLAKILQGSV